MEQNLVDLYYIVEVRLYGCKSCSDIRIVRSTGRLADECLAILIYQETEFLQIVALAMACDRVRLLDHSYSARSDVTQIFANCSAQRWGNGNVLVHHAADLP